MSYVICTLNNASNNINGFQFEDHKEGKISVDDLPDEVAASFQSIEGYKVVESKETKATRQGRAAAPAAPVADSNVEKAQEQLASDVEVAVGKAKK